MSSDEYERRAAALARYARWEKANPARATPAAALSAVGLLYELLPAAARRRAVDTEGVRRLHEALAVLTVPPE